MKVDRDKLIASALLWVISALLGIAPLFLGLADWHMETGSEGPMNWDDVVKYVVVSEDLYSGIMSTLFVGMLELILETGNKHYVLIFVNAVTIICGACMYIISRYRTAFLVSLFYSHNSQIGFLLFILLLSLLCSGLSVVMLSKKPVEANIPKKKGSIFVC